MLSTAPPSIPAGHKVARWDAHSREHLMMWVLTGRAHVRLADGELHRVDAGTGIWVPPGADHEMWTEAGSVAVPLSVPAAAVPRAPDRVVRFTVDDRWRDRLVDHYAQWLQGDPGTDDLLAVLDGAVPELPGPAPTTLTMPRPGAALTVADALRRQPALDHTLEEWAAATACSPSTLRRQFLHDTGIPFARWRTLCRLSAARDHLAGGGGIGDAAARAGFASGQSFARAFRERYGAAPRDFAARARSDDVPAPRASQDPGSVPARRSHGVAGWNELVWIYRGGARSRVGDTSVATRRGDALWIPAGQAYENVLPAGAVAVTLGDVCSDCVQVPGPLRARFPPSWDSYLLHCSVSGNTLLHPAGYHVRHVADLFDAQLAVERARTVPLPTDPRARAAATRFLRRPGGGGEDLPPEVHAAFRRETGMTFPAWRQAARMRVARDLLTTGTSVGAVAARVGYGGVANFSRAFSRFHGTAPREWQERELDPPLP